MLLTCPPGSTAMAWPADALSPLAQSLQALQSKASAPTARQACQVQHYRRYDQDASCIPVWFVKLVSGRILRSLSKLAKTSAGASQQCRNQKLYGLHGRSCHTLALSGSAAADQTDLSRSAQKWNGQQPNLVSDGDQSRTA